MTSSSSISGLHKLDTAISKMSKLLGSNDPVASTPKGNDNFPLISSNLEDYISLLNERYNKIVDLLSIEELSLKQAKETNSELKEKLASEVKSHEETVSLAKIEIENLINKNRSNLEKKQIENLNKQYKNIEKECLKEKNTELEDQIKEKMKLEVNLQEEIRENERIIKNLSIEKQTIESVFAIEEQRLKELEKKYNEFYLINDDLKKKLSETRTKLKDHEGKLDIIYNESTLITNNTEKIKEDIRQTLKKQSISSLKYSELEKLKENLKSELEIKNEQLNLIRIKNQELEIKVKNVEDSEKQLKVQLELQSHLKVENEILTQELQQISELLASNKINQKKNNDNSFNKNNKTKTENSFIEQNKKLRETIEEMEKDVEEKKNMIERQKNKLKEIENKKKNDEKNIENEEGEKKNNNKEYVELTGKLRGLMAGGNKEKKLKTLDNM